MFFPLIALDGRRERTMRIIMLLAAGLLLWPELAPAQCGSNTNGCNLACASTYGFGNTAHCVLFDNAGAVFGKLSFYPPCPQPGCFPYALALNQQHDGSVMMLMLQGNTSTRVSSFTKTKLSVAPLQAVNSFKAPNPPATKLAGFPLLQTSDLLGANDEMVGYVHRKSGATAASTEAGTIVTFRGSRCYEDFKFQKETLDYFQVDEAECRIMCAYLSERDKDGNSVAELFLKCKDGSFVRRTRRLSNGKPVGPQTSFKETSLPSDVVMSCDGSPQKERPVQEQGFRAAAEPKRFLVQRFVRQTSPSLFQSLIQLRLVDSAGKAGPPTTIVPAAKTVQPASEGFQSVAVDPRKNFVVFTGTTPACGAGILKFQKLNPNNGAKMGPPGILLDCPDLGTTITGMLGIDVINLK
jgi:hypothetical protein